MFQVTSVGWKLILPPLLDQINEIGFDTSNKFTESYAKMFSKKRPLECV